MILRMTISGLEPVLRIFDMMRDRFFFENTSTCGTDDSRKVYADFYGMRMTWQ